MKYSRLALYIVWIGIFYLRGGGSIDEGWDFLFGVDKTYIREFDDVYSKSDVWHMQNGVCTLLGITGFTILLFKEIWRGIKERKAPSETEESDIPQVSTKTNNPNEA